MDFSVAAKREEFRSYLENTGILDAIVEALVRGHSLMTSCNL